MDIHNDIFRRNDTVIRRNGNIVRAGGDIERRPQPPVTVIAPAPPSASPPGGLAELAGTQELVYSPVTPGAAAQTDESTPLFARVLRNVFEETAGELTPEIPAVNPAVPTAMDMSIMTAAINRMAVQSGAMWTIPQAYAGQLASTLINAAAVNAPPPKDDDRDAGTDSVESAPFAASGGGVRL